LDKFTQYKLSISEGKNTIKVKIHISTKDKNEVKYTSLEEESKKIETKKIDRQNTYNKFTW
jgi:hypothetical protein